MAALLVASAFQRRRRAACLILAALTSPAAMTAAQGPKHQPHTASAEASIRNASCAGTSDLVLRNGKIITMANSGATPAIVSEMIIRNGMVASLGTSQRGHYAPCTQVVDLKGRTAIPGLIDGHMHFVTWGFRPGRDVRLDLADSIEDVAQALNERARTVAPGEWITAVGGWSRTQLAEGRLPTRAELDVAAPANPIFVWERDGKPAIVNSQAARLLATKGIEAAADGSITAAGDGAATAYSIIAQSQTNPIRGTVDALAHLATLGVTTVSDMGVNAAPAGIRPPRRSWHSGHVDVYSAYDPLLELARTDRLTARVRISFMDTPDGPPHSIERLKYQFPLFGSDMVKTLCMGEFITPDPARYADAALAVARRGGWCHEQHVMGGLEIGKFVATWERVNAQVPLASRHWRLAHVFGIDDDSLRRLRSLDAGVNIAAMLYAPGNELPGPSREIRYRSILASGVPVGGVSDGPNYMPINPWVHISLIVRGKDSQGRQVVASDQTLTRMQALALYTGGNAWFMEDDRFGAIKPGGFGDVVVLDRDYLTVPDEQIRKIHSVMTIVGGRIVYADPSGAAAPD